MTCADRERSLALFAGGELGEGESVELERHLDGCAHCGAVLRELRDLREFLGEPVAGQPVVTPDVMRTLRRRRTGARMAMAAAVVLALAAGFVIRSGTSAVMPLQIAVSPPGPPRLNVVKPAAVERRVRKARRVRPPLVASHDRMAVVEPSEASAVVLKLVTDDPDVVIVWLGG